MTRPTLLLELDLPPKALTPNARPHFMTRANAAKHYRDHAANSARIVMGTDRLLWTEATVQVTFYFRDRRRRDPDNLAASLKAAWDGLRDAGVLADDDKLTHLPLRVATDRDGPRVRVEMWETIPGRDSGR